MEILAALAGVALILAVLLDAFETIVLPRRVMQRVRLARLFYKATWLPWSALARRIRNGGRREGFLSFYGPLSLIMLVVVWAVALIAGFALLQWSLGSKMHMSDGSTPDLTTDLYLSGSTFFTLGLGDVAPVTGLSRFIVIIEAGLGFTFLALIIGYLPALNGAFSNREVNVSLLDGRAGSPPSAVELLTRNSQGIHATGLREFLKDWERWSAQLLESHLSYPVLGYFRSQHEHQSWVAALTMVLDTCSLVMSGGQSEATRQAQLTFAMARHAAVDLSQIFETPPSPPHTDRLPPEDVVHMLGALDRYGVRIFDGGGSIDQRSLDKLAELRSMYEPYVHALSDHLLMPLPPWLPAPDAHDAWETTAWEGSASAKSTYLIHPDDVSASEED